MEPTIPNDPVRAFADPPLLDDAAELLAAARLSAIIYGFTSSSYLRDDDSALKRRLENRTRGIPVVIPCAAAVSALTALGATRLVLIDPPWFSIEMDREGARYFRKHGFELVHHAPAALPSDPRAIDPGQVYDWVRSHTPPSADAIFIGGNGFRAVAVVRALEQDLARPVLTANQSHFGRLCNFLARRRR
jgi:maleate isomerase